MDDFKKILMLLFMVIGTLQSQSELSAYSNFTEEDSNNDSNLDNRNLPGQLNSSDKESSGYSDYDDGIDKVKDILLKGRIGSPEEDGSDYSIQNNEESITAEDESDSNSLVGILVAIILICFIMLGVFNHVIIPMFCIKEEIEKDKPVEEKVTMTELKKSEEKEEDKNKRGSLNKGFEDVPLNKEETELQQRVSIENENVEKTVLMALSANNPSLKEVNKAENDEYTNTPRNSMVGSQIKDPMILSEDASKQEETINENIGDQPNKSKPIEDEKQKENHNGENEKIPDDQVSKKNEKENKLTDESLNLSEEKRIENTTEPFRPPEQKSGNQLIDSSTPAKQEKPVLTEEDGKTETPAGDANGKVDDRKTEVKEKFRSRKKSTMSIEIEDGNITKFVEGSGTTKGASRTETIPE